MTYYVFSGTLNPTHFTSLHLGQRKGVWPVEIPVLIIGFSSGTHRKKRTAVAASQSRFIWRTAIKMEIVMLVLVRS